MSSQALPDVFPNQMVAYVFCSLRYYPYPPNTSSIGGLNVGGKRMDATRKDWLTAAFVGSVSRPGVYGDKHGLQLRVYQSRKRKSISKQWIWRGTVNGVRRDVGLVSCFINY